MLQIFEEHDAVIMMSDEAYFHLNDTVNKQNCRYWAAENPRAELCTAPRSQYGL